MAKEIIPIRKVFKMNNFPKSLRIALKGIIFLFLYHRNMRIIFLCGLAAALLGVYFNLKGIELIALCITITLVFMAEIFNTAIEMLMNIISEEYNTRIRIVKDIAAGIVLVTCINALLIGYALFLRRL